MYNFQLKQVYSFDVYPAALLGNNFKKVTVLAVMDYEMALQSADVEAMHNQFRTYLPVGSPARASDYNYVLVRMPNGERTVLGLAWIKDASVELIASTTITVVIQGQPPSAASRVSAALQQNGFSDFTLTTG